MGLWNTVKDWGKTIWNGLKRDLAPKSNEETLNDKINNGTLGEPNNTGSAFNKTLNETINDGITVEDNSLYAPSKSVLDDPEDVLGVKSGDALVAEEKRKEEMSAREALGETTNQISDAYDALKKEQDIDWNMRTNKDVMAVGYDKLGGNVLTLNIDDNNRLEAYYRGYARVVNDPNATEVDKTNAFLDFYNEAKELFVVEKLDKAFNKRYNEDTLNTLSNNKVTRGKYVPSMDEFATYFNLQAANDGKRQDMLKEAGLGVTNKDRVIVDLEANESSKWFSNWNEYSSGNIPELIKSSISKTDGGEGMEALAYYEDAQRSLGNAIYQHVAAVYAKERVALSKAPNERNSGDLYVIQKAEELRQMEKQLGANLAEWMRQELKYGVNEKGEIKDALDSFENGENLNDVLTKGLREISGEGWGVFNFRQSPVDIFEAVANDALYKYNQANVSDPLRKGWNRVEQAFRPVGITLGEVGQILHEGSAEILTLGTAKYTSYLNNDFSIGKLIETDDGKRKRNIKKYTLEAMEYLPEGLGNTIPDIAALIASQGATLPSIAAKFGSIAKIARGFKTVRDLEKASSLVSKGLKGLDRLNDISKQLMNIDKKWKLVANAIDRGITQVALGQVIDAQWSAYDTEPYSTASYALSALPAVFLDFMPELTTLKGIIRKPMGSVRSLVDYIESSPEAASNVAKALWKKNPQFSLTELEQYARTFGEIEQASKNVYNNVLTDAERASAGQWTKQMMYNYVTQAYGANTTIAKNVRQILSQNSLNPADIIKYVGQIPGTVAFGPYTSSITLKHGTQVGLTSTGTNGQYKAVLDNLDGGFDKRLTQGFTSEDIEKISTFDGFKRVLDQKDELFFKLGDNYYLTDKGLKEFGLEKGNIPLESFGVTVAEAENVREVLKERMKDLKGIQLNPKTIDKLADGGGYNEIVKKVKEVLGC